MERSSDFYALEYQSPNSDTYKGRFTATVWYNEETGEISGVQRENPSLEDPKVVGAKVQFDCYGALPKLVDSSREIPFTLKNVVFKTLRAFRDSSWEVHIV